MEKYQLLSIKNNKKLEVIVIEPMAKIDGKYTSLGGGDWYYDRKTDKIQKTSMDIVEEMSNFHQFQKIVSSTFLGQLPLLSQSINELRKMYLDTKLNVEVRKIVAAQQYALKNSKEHMGCVTKIKLAWENGFETCQEYHKSEKIYFDLDMYANELAFLQKYSERIGLDAESRIEEVEEIIESLSKIPLINCEIDIQEKCKPGCMGLILNGEKSICCGDYKTEFTVKSILLIEEP